MNTLVVFLAFAAAACGSLVPVAQPLHHPAIVLDPHGRPLDTAEVINARALHLQAKALDGHYLADAAVVAPVAHSVIAPAVVAAPAAVSHQSRVDVISSPAVVSHTIAAPILAHSALGFDGHGHYLKKRSLGHLTYAAPVVAIAPSAVSHQSRVDVISSPAVVSHTVVAPVLAHSVLGLAGHGHYLKKRSLGHLAYAAPVVAVAPSAVSHQSRFDVISSPAVVSHAVAAPVISHAVAAPVVAVAPAAVSHSSRVDVRTSPAVVTTAVHAAPLYAAHSALAAPVYGAHAGLALSHGHLLKKRSLAQILTPVVHTVPAAVSHQSRVDVISKPAVTEVVAAPLLAHSVPAFTAPALYAAPIAHSAIWTAPLALKAAHW